MLDEKVGGGGERDGVRKWRCEIWESRVWREESEMGLDDCCLHCGMVK